MFIIGACKDYVSRRKRNRNERQADDDGCNECTTMDLIGGVYPTGATSPLSILNGSQVLNIQRGDTNFWRYETLLQML